MTYNRFSIRQLIGRALGIDRPNPQLWGLIIKESGGAAEFLSSLENERISFLALPGLKRNSEIPDGIVKQVEKSKLGSLANNLYLLKVFEEVSAYLNGEKITHIPIKGLDLIRDFYDDPALRPISDIDILVKPTQFGEAVEILRSRGFNELRIEQTLPGVWPAVNLTRADGRKPVWVDLHYCLGPAVGNRIKSTLAMFGDIDTNAPLPPEYRLIILAAHHQNHFMEIPIIAYYELLRLFYASEHERLFKLARRWQVAGAVSSALNQAAWIFGVPMSTVKKVKNDILRYLVGNGLRDRRGGFSGFEGLTYLLSLDNPGIGIPFGLELLYKKIISNI